MNESSQSPLLLFRLLPFGLTPRPQISPPLPLPQELQPTVAKAGAGATAVEYRLTYFTGGQMAGGTDARVYTELIGADGTSEALVMDGDKALFERKSQDTFTRAVTAKVGELQKVNVWHDGSGKEWNLEKLLVEHVASGREWEIVVGQWIDKGREKNAPFPVTRVTAEGASDVDTAFKLRQEQEAAAKRLAAAGVQMKEVERSKSVAAAAAAAEERYLITFHTSGKLFAGTEQPVFLQIRGRNGDKDVVSEARLRPPLECTAAASHAKMRSKILSLSVPPSCT